MEFIKLLSCTAVLGFRAAVYANRHYLNIYRRTHPDRLASNKEDGPKIIGDVFIHPTASVHPTAVVSGQQIRHYHLTPTKLEQMG